MKTIDVSDLPESEAKMIQNLVLMLKSKITITKPYLSEEKDVFANSAGSWKGTVDADELVKDIYADRLISTRQEVNL